MKLRFRTSIASATWEYHEGRVIEVPEPLPAEFMDWLRCGVVEAVKDETEDELAIVDALPETAVRPNGSGQSGRSRSRGSGRRARSSVSEPDPV